jgi:mono/diheme cytochrome c family protein
MSDGARWPMAVLLATAVVACQGATGAVKDCRVSMPAVLTDSGVGALRVGATVEEVRAACHVLRDTTFASGREGMFERQLTVVLGSIATSATVSDGRVWRIEIASPRFRTRDSLGVGSTVAQLRSGASRVAAGANGGYVVRSDHCGLAFQLGGVLARAGMRVEQIADTARVDMVLVVGCDAAPSGDSPAAVIALGDSIYHGRVGAALCYMCHGVRARGTNVAPDLTDDQWLHGDGSEASIAEIIRRGVATPKRFPGVMPPRGGGTLTESQVRAVAAYLRSLG